jgi:hypothetical protein
MATENASRGPVTHRTKPALVALLKPDTATVHEAGVKGRVRAFLKCRLAACAGGLLGLSVALAVYDAVCFQPVLAGVRLDMRTRLGVERKPPVRVIAMLALDGPRDVVPYTARLLLRRAGEADPVRPLAWQFKYALWCSLVDWHVPLDERYAVIAAYAPNGPQGTGLSEAAHALFGKELQVLSSTELAALVVLIRAPSIRGDAGNWAAAARRLAQRYDAQHGPDQAPAPVSP